MLEAKILSPWGDGLGAKLKDNTEATGVNLSVPQADEFQLQLAKPDPLIPCPLPPTNSFFYHLSKWYYHSPVALAKTPSSPANSC